MMQTLQLFSLRFITKMSPKGGSMRSYSLKLKAEFSTGDAKQNYCCKCKDETGAEKNNPKQFASRLSMNSLLRHLKYLPPSG
jgi:hypothetical protein